MFLIVGLPGAGKTTRAKELEVSRSALRLTPDDWLMAIFDTDGPAAWRTQERVDHRDRIEGLLVDAGLRAARLGLDVVLDFGFWGRDERAALRGIAASVGIATEVVYLPIELEEQRRRIATRFASAPGHFEMTDEDLAGWRRQFEEPDAEELGGGTIPPVPDGHPSWWHWAATRWPSFPLPEDPTDRPTKMDP